MSKTHFDSVVFKKVDPQIIRHDVEKRGFVQVPFDYQDSDSQKISIFYRLIPSYGSRPNDTSKPVIVVINGGPGMASHVYRPINFNYENLNAPENGTLDRFKYLLNSYRILIVDQRGTDGQSAPIDIDHPSLNANIIARYFSSNSHARDYLAVIEEVIPKDEPFYIIAQSYGGMPGMQFIGLNAPRKPRGMVFSCSALPYADMIEECSARRTEQLKLNHQLKVAFPDTEERMDALKAHFQSLGLNPDEVNGLFSFLGKGVTGVWEKNLISHIEKLMTQNRAEIEKSLNDHFGKLNILNYILSSANFSPGHTDRTLAKLTSEKIPFEPWMIDENWIFLNAGNDGTWREKFLSDMDQAPPPPTPFPKSSVLKKEISKHQLLFVTADNYAFVPAESYARSLQKFLLEGHTHVENLPGGHNAIFLEKGYDAFQAWARNLTF